MTEVIKYFTNTIKDIVQTTTKTPDQIQLETKIQIKELLEFAKHFPNPDKKFDLAPELLKLEAYLNSKITQLNLTNKEEEIKILKTEIKSIPKQLELILKANL